MLLDRRLLEILAERLDLGSDVQRLDIGDLTELMPVAPGEEPHDGVVIGRPRVLVADGRLSRYGQASMQDFWLKVSRQLRNIKNVMLH